MRDLAPLVPRSELDDFWRTEVDPAQAAAYGCATIPHIVFFAPLNDRGGAANCVAVNIPEAGGRLIRTAMRRARQGRARVLFVCDTVDQAAAIAHRAARLLPRHRRVPYEKAEAGAWGPPQ